MTSLGMSWWFRLRKLQHTPSHFEALFALQHLFFICCLFSCCRGQLQSCPPFLEIPIADFVEQAELIIYKQLNFWFIDHPHWWAGQLLHRICLFLWRTPQHWFVLKTSRWVQFLLQVLVQELVSKEFVIPEPLLTPKEKQEPMQFRTINLHFLYQAFLEACTLELMVPTHPSHS